ncbi:MAG: hypothetical protein KDC24_03975 [Saprospiraceae bacterium]|nr:hypothetical protein [Saprospiraceae bacterium]
MRTKVFSLLVILFSFFSCVENFNQEPVLPESEITTIRILEKLNLASKSPAVSDSFENFPCSIEVEADCFEFTETITLMIDLTECSSNVSGLCSVTGFMNVIICEKNNGQDLEVNFTEDVFAHSTDCIIGLPHTDDWDCIAEAFYTEYVHFMMPLILAWWGEKSKCDNGYTSAISNYFKSLCIYPCSYQEGDVIFYEIVQCGESTACCVKKEYWCTDQKGNIQITNGGNTQIGLCSEGPIPCNNYIDFPFKHPDCFPRDCIQEIIPD